MILDPCALPPHQKMVIDPPLQDTAILPGDIHEQDQILPFPIPIYSIAVPYGMLDRIPQTLGEIFQHRPAFIGFPLLSTTVQSIR